MMARPVMVLSDARTRERYVRVPLGGRGLKGHATIDLQDWDAFLARGYSGNLDAVSSPNTSKLYVTCADRSARGNHSFVSRIILNAKPGQKIRYLDGEPRNLRRSNLQLVGEPYASTGEVTETEGVA